MKNLTINAKNHTIEMTKAFTAAASVFGSDEYNQLQTARRDYPTYRVVTVKQKGAKPEYKGMDYKYMEKYIAAHDNENGSIMAEYKMLTGKSEAGKDAMADAACYADVREWFLMTYPEIEKFHADRDALLEKIAQRRAAKQAAKKAA